MQLRLIPEDVVAAKRLQPALIEADKYLAVVAGVAGIHRTVGVNLVHFGMVCKEAGRSLGGPPAPQMTLTIVEQEHMLD